MVLSPPHWKTYGLNHALAWQAVAFSAGNASKIAPTKGVYTFLVQPGIAMHPCCSYLLYVGKTEDQNHRSRYRQYISDLRAGGKSRRPHITEMLEKWDGYLWFCYAEVPDADIHDMEEALLTAYLPPANKQFPATVRRTLQKMLGI